MNGWSLSFPTMLTNVYIDGFNLYYRAVKGTPFKWLDLSKLAENLFPKDEIQSISYFTAHISERSSDKEARLRQLVHLRALRTLPNLTIHLGQFRTRVKFRPLRHDPSTYVEVLDAEEKGSDVNLATRLLMDAITGDYEQAVIISNDADFAGAMRSVRDELSRKVSLVSPETGNAQIPKELQSAATYVRKLRKTHLRASQFPEQLSDQSGVILKPSGW